MKEFGHGFGIALMILSIGGCNILMSRADVKRVSDDCIIVAHKMYCDPHRGKDENNKTPNP